jgi:Trk K+ transport system NAD-binding subunit
VGRYTLRQKIRYRLDLLIARSPVWQVLILAALSAFIVVLGTIAIGNAAPESLGAEGQDGLVYRIWWSVCRLMDPGTFVDDFTTAAVAVTGLLITLGGVLVFSLLIGVLSSKLAEKLESLKRGKSMVVERDHTIILGAGDKLFEIIKELIEANANQKDRVIVVCSPTKKVEMEETLRERIDDFKTTRVVCRRGRLTDIDALRILGFDTARSVVVLGESDEETVKVLLAAESLKRGNTGLAAVCEVHNRSMGRIASLAFPGLRWIAIGEVITRLTVQVCRQPGLSAVYGEVLSFAGNEFYFIDASEVVGRRFGEVFFQVEGGIAVGMGGPGGIRINPRPEETVGPDDQLLVLTEDDDTCRVNPEREPPFEVCSAELEPEAPGPESVLILAGESPEFGFMLHLLDSYVGPGSRITVAGSLEDAASVRPMENVGALRNCSVEYVRTERTSFESLKTLDPLSYDSILVPSGKIPPVDDEEADSECIVTLLILRQMRQQTGTEDGPIIISQIRNPRNRRLATAAEIDDFVVSNEVTSMVLAQLSEEPALKEVYDEIFDPSGCEIQLRRMGRYCPDDGKAAFLDILRAGLERRELPLGYLLRPEGNGGSWRVILNPPWEERPGLGPDDRVVVIAER